MSETFCRLCAIPGKIVEVVMNGEVVGVGQLCDGCFAKAMVEYETLQAKFEALLAAGVDPERANEIMCAEIDGSNACA